MGGIMIFHRFILSPFLRETLIKALPRQGESEKTMEFLHVKPKALMLI